MDADKVGAGHKGSDDGPNRDDDVVIESEAEEELDKKNETDDEEFRADSDGDDQGDGLSNSDRTSDAHSVGGESEGFHTEEEDPPILKDPRIMWSRTNGVMCGNWMQQVHGQMNWLGSCSICQPKVLLR